MEISAARKRPTRERVRRIRDRLRKLYGRPLPSPHRRPVDELVRTILSQATSDSNRDRAFAGLMERFPPAQPPGRYDPEVDWVAVRDAPVEEIEAAIRPGGLSRQKAPRIQKVLELIGPELDLDWLETAPREEVMDFLCGLPGVGRKTAACIQIFTWGIPEIPVDTHVYRVGGRLGLFPEKISFEKAHDEMLAITPPEDAYELHINLIRHGRQICRPKPRCAECGLRRMCPAAARFMASEGSDAGGSGRRRRHVGAKTGRG